MEAYVRLFTSSEFLIAVLAAVSAAAVVFTFGTSLVGRSEMKSRIKRVALERERLRAEEMARLRGDKGTMRRGAETRDFVRSTVDRFSLQKIFADQNTAAKLAAAGFRAPGHISTFVFARFITPFVMFTLAFAYLSLTVFADKPFYLNLLYALFIGLVGMYLPILWLKNRTTKRQFSIKRAWPDCLDLMLLCVEAGMSIEHAFKRVAKEIGMQSPELSEELTLTNAELSFLEDRTRAYDNLGKRTGLDGVKSVMTALIQADRYGTSIGSSLRVMAEEGREQRMMDAEKKAAALPPKLTVPLILFILPTLFIVIISPAMIKVFSSGVSFNV